MMSQRNDTRRPAGKLLSGLVLLLAVLLFCVGSMELSAGKTTLWLSSGQRDEIPIYSSYAVLKCMDDGAVLMEKNGAHRMYPASLTKIMTLLVALQDIGDLEEKVTLPDSIFIGLETQNASMAGFLPGESVRAIDLVYGCMLSSGAECSVGLALLVSGGEQAFVQRMNEEARELGLKDTHFENVWGIQDKGHYSTAEDMSVILEEALKNPVFYEAFTASRYAAAPTNLHPQGLPLESTLFSRQGSWEWEDGRILGGKTGYTDEAGLCLASLAQIGGKRYVLVTAGALGSHQTRQYHIEDAFAVYRNVERLNAIRTAEIMNPGEND